MLDILSSRTLNDLSITAIEYTIARMMTLMRTAVSNSYQLARQGPPEDEARFSVAAGGQTLEPAKRAQPGVRTCEVDGGN